MELKVIPIVQVIIAMALMAAIQSTIPTFAYTLQLSNYISGSLVFIGIIIGFSAIYSFRKHQTTVNPSKPESSSTVVNSGIYHYSRNPMYVAMLLALLAYAFYLENLLAFVICGVFIWYISKYQIIPEERMLEKLFGQEYQHYCQQVRRWI